MSFLRKQKSRFISAQAETQKIGTFLFWIPTFVGKTIPNPPHLANLSVGRPLPPGEKRIATIG